MRLIGCFSSEWILPTSTALTILPMPSGRMLEIVLAEEEQPQRRVERDGQHRGHHHGEILGVRQRLEQAAFLRFQREHRQERDRDHQQREEAGAAHFLHRIDDGALVVATPSNRRPAPSSFLCVCSTTTMAASTIAPTAIAMPPSDMMFELMPMACIGTKEMITAIGNGHDRNDGARDVPQEDQDHQADDDQFFDQRVLQIVDRCEDQLAAVVGGDQLQPGGRPGSISLIFAFTRSMTAQRVLALPHHDDAGDHFALAVEIGDAAAHVGPERHAAHVAHQDRHARLR